MRNLRVGMVVLALGCATAGVRSSGEPEVADADRQVADAASSGALERPALPRPPEEPAAPTTAAGAPACSASIGLDLRALPTNTGPDGIDMFVLGQGQRIRELTPPGAELEIRHVPGWGSLIPVFRAATADEAEAVCLAVVAEYLEHAPRLPVIMESAATLVEPCHPWSAPPGAAPPAD